MTTEPISVDVSDMPELARLAEEVRRTGEARVLTRHGEDLAVLAPAPPRQRDVGDKPRTEEEREATFWSAFGGWKGNVDTERLKRDIREARSDSRPPVEL